ncbi:ribosome small subunit-dependent GTPase A [Nonomuraea sp. NPDC050227]|uniref:ribosome small subunit-dependent GTPase A n=1 Tax=Nonomuraea sp. NPDC050227 TaxID=3364360 RepID=UPI00379E4E9E
MSHTYTDPSGLSRYGWTGTLDRTFTEHYEAGLVPARISRVDRGLCTAVTAEGPTRATFAAPHPPDPLLTPCTGDWAALRPGAEPQLVALAPGVDVLVTSAATGRDIDVLAALVRGTTVLLGPSGAGKSSLGNALLGADLLATGTVRAQDGKGRHTTVRRELLPLPGGGVLIDTPGLRGISLHDAADGLEQVFAEIEELAALCRFADCAHDTEPGCTVQAAIQSGELSGRRLRSYRKLQRENAWAASRTDARLRDERVNHQKAITGHLRATYRFRDRQS